MPGVRILLGAPSLGCSQVGKAPDFDSGIPQVRVLSPQPYDPLAQLAEHLTFNQGVPRSSRGWITILRRGTEAVITGRS